MDEAEGSIIVASREERVRPHDEAKQWITMAFVNLLGKVVKVINGGDHSERERGRVERKEKTSTTIIIHITHSLIDKPR